MATIEERLDVIEQRLAVVPLAANPPITIGELTDVPAPGSPIASAWANKVSSRVIQRFANMADLRAKWANAPVGAHAHITSLGLTIRNEGTDVWVADWMFQPQPPRTTGADATVRWTLAEIGVRQIRAVVSGGLNASGTGIITIVNGDLSQLQVTCFAIISTTGLDYKLTAITNSPVSIFIAMSAVLA